MKMVRDRFSEFQQCSNWSASSWRAANAPTTSSGGVAAGTSVASTPSEIDASALHQQHYDTSSRSQLFLRHVDELRASIDQLHRRIHHLQKRQFAILSQTVVRPEEKDQLARLIDEVKLHIRSLRPRVRQLETDLRQDETAGPSALRTTAELRIRRNQCEMLKLKLNDLLMLFNQTQVEYKSRVSKRVKRQMELAGKQLSAQQVDEMLDSKSQEVFYCQLTPQTFAAQMALDDATSRHNELLTLEQSVFELNDVFCDMYELVHSQNVIVDHIATNVEAANHYTKDAQVHVKRAVTYKRSAQRKQCIIVLLAVIAGLILALLLFALFNSLFAGGPLARARM